MLLEQFKRFIILTLITVFNFFPIKKNKIMLFSYYGTQYGCSPKYISEYIVSNYPKGKFDVVWAFTNLESRKKTIEFRTVKFNSIKYYYELCTSKIIITNFRTTDFFKKRTNQYYIQTWHSSLRLKQIEKDAENVLPIHYVKMAKKDSLKCDLLLSGCEYSSKIFKRAFWFNGEILECGTPANDILVNSDLKKIIRIKEKLNIPIDCKVVLYAPTFRKNSDLSVYSLEYELLIKTLEKRFSGNWIMLVRLHPHLTALSKNIKQNRMVKNVTLYDDVQELMVISDLLITDYSSVMFSFILTKKPCFLYVPDLNHYKRNDRKLYFKVNELPFECASTNNELRNLILNFNDTNYAATVSGFLNKINSFEKGKACKRLMEKIEREIS